MIEIKVLHIINTLISGGAEKMLADIVTVMNQKENIKVEVLILSDNGNVFEGKIRDNKIPLYKSRFKSIYNPLNVLVIRDYLRKGDYDIVHVHLFPSNYWTSLAKKGLIGRRKPKLITTEHSTFNKRRDKKYLRNIEKFIYSSYDKIISISNKTEENLIKWLKINNNSLNKFNVIENGIDVYKYQAALPYTKSEINSKFKDDTKLLCMVGSFTSQKDQKTIINSIKRLNTNIHLVLIGEGKLLEEHREYARKIRVDDRIHFLGFRSDVDRIFRTVDIIILSSHWEGFGLVAVEGMAAEKPLIASNVDGLSAVVNNAGMLFEKGDDKELAITINRLLENSELYEDIKRKSLRRALEFDINKTVEKYLEIYNE